jgi:DNA-binding MarR family transcriptional regulator
MFMPLPSDMSRLCFGHRSRMTARAVTRAFNARLRPLNLQITQYILLGVLAQGQDLSIAGLADQLDLEPSALSRNLRLLQGRGLIEIAGGRGPKGLRQTVTPAGRALLEAGVPIWNAIQADLSRTLEGQAEAVRAALTTLEAAALSLDQSRS